jgi:putative transcriptional regulator
MRPSHHPLPETLMSFASGTLSNATAAVVACHLAMCRACANDARRLELVGGLLLDHLETGPADTASAERALARSHRREETPKRSSTVMPEHIVLPPLLARNLPPSDEISWQRIAPGVRQYLIAMPNGAGQMRLLRISPGEPLPKGMRQGVSDVALVLQGAFSGAAGEDYGRGDVIEWADGSGPEVTAAGTIECACLIVNEGADNVVRPFGPARGPRRGPFQQTTRLAEMGSVPAALAASLAMIVGLSLGWLVWGGQGTGAVTDLVSAEGNRILAQGSLREALNTLPSGEQKTALVSGQDLRLGIKMTFQDQEGSYCRQYRIEASPSEHYAGIACRKGEEWGIKIQGLVPPAASASQRTIPANGANAAMDALVGAWSAGDPIVGEDEAGIMKKGWRP